MGMAPPWLTASRVDERERPTCGERSSTPADEALLSSNRRTSLTVVTAQLSVSAPFRLTLQAFHTVGTHASPTRQTGWAAWFRTNPVTRSAVGVWQFDSRVRGRRRPGVEAVRALPPGSWDLLDDVTEIPSRRPLDEPPRPTSKSPHERRNEADRDASSDSHTPFALA